MSARRLSQPYPFCLRIEKLALPVRLGVTAEEQAQAQTVFADVTLYYPSTPEAFHRDTAEYLCYDELCRAMRAVAEEQPVALVEWLTGALYRRLRPMVPPEAKLRIVLRKPLPQSLVGYEVQGAAVEYTDLEEGLA